MNITIMFLRIAILMGVYFAVEYYYNAEIAWICFCTVVIYSVISGCLNGVELGWEKGKERSLSGGNN